MVPINPWLMMKAGEYLGESLLRIADADFKEEQRLKAEKEKKKREKELAKLKEKWAREDEEREMKHRDPHYTWMFNHFDFGTEFVYYTTLY